MVNYKKISSFIIMEVKKGRLVKGSDAAKSFMAELRAKRGKKGGGGSAAPPASDCSPAPKQEDIIIEPPPVEARRRSRKKITVDFNNV
jgi:hypothetical protein